MEATPVDKRGQPIHIHYLYGRPDPFWVPVTWANIHGVWKSFAITTQTTTSITEPENGGYLIITGITMSAKKVNAGQIQLRFSDGTNNELFFDALTTNEPLNNDLNWSDQRVWGWKDAKLEVVTAGANPTLTGMVRYFKAPAGVPYPVWQSLQ